MARYIEIPGEPDRSPATLTVGVNDVLRFSGSGILVEDGSCIEVLGILVEAVLGTNGEIVAPVGSPNVVLVRARSSGTASIEIVTGGLWESVRNTSRLVIRVLAD